MPPRRASTAAKKKIVKTVRLSRRSAAAAAAEAETLAAEAVEENPTSENLAAAEAPAAVETPAASEEVTGGPVALEDATLQAEENPTAEPAAAGETTIAMEEDAPQAAEEPALEIPAAVAATATVDEIPVVAEEATIIAECPSPEITPQTLEAQTTVPVAGSDAGPGFAAVEEEHAIEPANAVETAAEIVEAVPRLPPAKKTTKLVRKVVTRRVAVKKTPSRKELEPDTMKEEKGDGRGEEAAAPPASVEGEQTSDGAQAVAVSVEEGNSAGAEGVSMSVEAQNPSEAGAMPPPVEEQKPVPCADQPPAVEPAPHVEATSAAASSADGALPVAAPQKRVRKVKKIVVVRRPVKAKETSKKEEKVKKADEGAAEKVASSGSVANASEPSKMNENSMEVEAASIPDGSLCMAEEDVVPDSCGDDAGKGDSGKRADAEQEKLEGAGIDNGSTGDQMMGMSERQKRRKTEIFIGGLDRNAKEDDIRKVFEKVGEIVEVRMMMDKKTGKNKGYAFLRYATAAQAKQAVSEFAKVEVCGKQCGAAALEGNDTIFLGNIDKKWKKDDITNLLQEIGVEKIDTVTLMLDPKNPDCNRGFAFLDFETNRDAQAAFKKLQKKDAFGKGQNIKVAWAEPLVDPDEEEMQKVKSVFAEGIPSSWDEKKVKGHFKRFGQIERVVLSRNMHSAKRKDFAFVNFATREAALSCIETFDKETADNGSKVNIKVSLAKPVQKNKQSKAGKKSSDKDSSKVKSKAVQHDAKVNIPAKSQFSRGTHLNIGEDKSSTTRELLHVLREQATWKQHSYPTGPAIPDYSGALHGRKRPLSAVGENPLYADPRSYPRARLDSGYPVAGPSYSSLSHSMAGTSLEYYQQSSAGPGTGSVYGSGNASRTFQIRPGSGTSYGSGMYSR